MIRWLACANVVRRDAHCSCWRFGDRGDRESYKLLDPRDYQKERETVV